jgi:hypothetical protein
MKKPFEKPELVIVQMTDDVILSSTTQYDDDNGTTDLWGGKY